MPKRRRPKSITPVCTITADDVAQARARCLAPDELVATVATLREGGPRSADAAAKLRNSFSYMALQKLMDHTSYGDDDTQADELLSTWMIDLADAIGLLANNAVEPTADAIERHIACHLFYSRREYEAEQRDEISVPYSTNTSRRKRGDEPIAAVRRSQSAEIEDDDGDERIITPLHDDPLTARSRHGCDPAIASETAAGLPYASPSRLVPQRAQPRRRSRRV